MNKSEWTTIGLAASTLVVTSSVTLILPFASGSVIDYTIASGENGGTSPLVLASGLFALSSLAGGGVYLRTLWLAKAGNRIVARIKQRLYSSILRKDSSFLDRQTTGDLLSRLTSDAQLLQGALTTQAVAGMRATVMSLGAFGMLLYTSPTLALVSCATLPPIFILTRHFSKQLKTRQERVQKLLGEATSLAEQALSHPTTVKQSVAETYETVRYRNGVAAAHAESVDTAHMQAQLEAGSHISANAAPLRHGSITAGDLTGFVMYSLLMAGNLSSMTSIYGEVVRASAASSRIFELMDQSSNVVSSKGHNDYNTTVSSTDPNTNNPSQRAASIEIENLSFRYPSRPDVPVINNLNLTIPAGGVLALVGASGSGKSTIGSLLTRLYDTDDNNNRNKDETESAIRINGKCIRDYDPQDLRQMISVVSQEPILFRGSIRDNIRYGVWDNASEESIIEAARQAYVMEFVDDFPDGLDTLVGQTGMQLSGGQRQRIAIARMLANNKASIYIMDEATSALDAQSEHYVQSALQKIFTEHSGKTIISIAHRLSTIRHATSIAVLQKGKVVQMGTFEELSTQEGAFYELMKTQLL
ncbi:P-loop containing nucleoside triphosphate hydrolase protein [Fragilariopsis cylindrus CCMP1102]|uniref:p-loop containing nucleoside triphosphate hydrolase protein n=1 Tax=Fragilariopsis cylindrus CCMP1102 TaxID=635003 RepID=A0A1E7F719_9STRA|nr:P-loop containing nucleoside triphosphate hydrolase protein [Fragilariopsis cylindrus CCMP1102]|eukprot:OEU13971.1 P-loop containing nucleoside triphosphate hydrolase protein [Fragilariopsis cylindrus CCMP1102]